MSVDAAPASRSATPSRTTASFRRENDVAGFPRRIPQLKASDQPAAYLYGVVDWELLGAGSPEGHRSAAGSAPTCQAYDKAPTAAPINRIHPDLGLTITFAPGYLCKPRGTTSRAPPRSCCAHPHRPPGQPLLKSHSIKDGATCRRAPAAPSAHPRPTSPHTCLTPPPPPLTARRSRRTATRAAPPAVSRRRRRPSSIGPTTPSTSAAAESAAARGTAGAFTARRRGSPRTAAVAASSTSC